MTAPASPKDAGMRDAGRVSAIAEGRSGAVSGLALALLVGISIGAAAFGGLFTSRGVSEWYPTIAKPSWTPDASLIGLAWTVLYPLIGVAGWLIWRAGPSRLVTAALVAWGVQMALNAAWSGLFFGLRSPGLAFAGIVLLWLAIAATIALAWRPSLLGAVLFVPYLAWVSFAGALNLAIWRLN
jgi:benzodiazapine receptor